MFNDSEAEEIKGLEKFKTIKVTNMRGMFSNSQATLLDLSSFDTKNVTNMYGMFHKSKAKEIKGLEKFKTTKVTNMGSMFSYSQVTLLDLSSFDTSNVTNTSGMFASSQATTGYARNQEEVVRLNSTFPKPTGLNFTIKK